ncbi:MAG: NusG domain II-containing protein [Clostridiaceae bacterium]
MRDENWEREHNEIIRSYSCRRNKIILYILISLIMINVTSYFTHGYENSTNKGYVAIYQDGMEVQKVSVPVLGRKVVEFPLHHQGKYESFALEIVNGSVRIRKSMRCKVETNTNNEWIRRSDEIIQIVEMNVKIFFVQ